MRLKKRSSSKVCLLLAAVLVASACANTSPDAVAYRTIGTIGVTANTAAKGWGDYVRAKGRCSDAQIPGCVSTVLERKVMDAWDKYQQALDVAERAITAWKAVAAANPNADPASLNAAVHAVSDAVSALVGIVALYTGGK
jgi:hypothetical protein